MPGEGGRQVDRGRWGESLARHARRHGVPGALLGLLRDGHVEISCYGVADVRTRRPVTLSTPFSLGSLTKPIVATVIARLVASGDLSFEDSVADRVPETAGVDWAQRATLRDLLANRSGVPLTADLEFGFDARQGRDEGALARYTAEIASAAPSPRSWSYSNAGWCLLGRVVEVVGGQPFEDVARHHLAEGGIIGIGFADAGPVPDRVSGHDLGEAGPVAVSPLVNRAYAAAGASSTSAVGPLLDLARWHLSDPDLAVLRETAASFSLPGWFDGWGLGWGRFDWSPGPAWGWDGMVNGERSCVRLLPHQQAAVVLAANAASGRALARTLLPEVVAEAFGVRIPALDLVPTPGAAGDLSPFEGVYAWPDRRIEVVADGQQLLLRETGVQVEARPVDGRTFVLSSAAPDGPTCTFGSFAEDGRPGVLYDMVWGLPRDEGP